MVMMERQGDAGTLSPPRGRAGGGSSSARDAAVALYAAPTLKLAALHFDAARAQPNDGSWRKQSRVFSPRSLSSQSPRLRAIGAQPSTSNSSRAVAALAGKSDSDIVRLLLENDLNSTTFVEYLRHQGASPATLMPWLHTLAALASKVGTLLESTRFLTCDLQLARILHHIQTAAKAMVGARRAVALVVSAHDDAIYRVGERGELLSSEPSESLSRGSSYAAHCARSAKPLLIGLNAGEGPVGPTGGPSLHYFPDATSGGRSESSLCVPCLDHVGNVLAVIQVIDKHEAGRTTFGQDDLLLLQRFAQQCGISLRNARATQTFGSAAPTGALMAQSHRLRRHEAAEVPSSRAVPPGAAADSTHRRSLHHAFSYTSPLEGAHPSSEASATADPGGAAADDGRAGSGAAAAATGGRRKYKLASRGPRTSDASCQCELLT